MAKNKMKKAYLQLGDIIWGKAKYISIPVEAAMAMKKGQEGVTPSGTLFRVLEEPWWDFENGCVLVHIDAI